MASIVPDQQSTQGPAAQSSAPVKRPFWSAAAGAQVGQFAAIFVAAYIFFKMFYIFNEGLAQPADILLAMVGLLIALPRLILNFFQRHTLLFVLLGWIATVNVAWVFVTGNLTMATPISYYLFNIIVAMVAYAVRLRNPDLFDRYVVYAIRAAAVVQLAALYTDDNFRPLGTFQNPNQLAYWGVVVLSMYLVIRRNQSHWLDLPFLLMLAYCVIASLSRAGAIAVLLLLGLWFWIILKRPMQRAMGVLVGAMLLLTASQTGYIGNYLSQTETVEDFEIRGELDADTNMVEERNYDRIIDFYEYTLLGAGEGYYTRFESSSVLAVEIHSSFGTMLFSYGIIGLLLFCTFLWTVIRALPLTLSWYLLPPLLYGVTHQGLRFSFFWVLIGIMLAMGDQLKQRLPPPQPAKARRNGPAAANATLRPLSPRGPEELRKRASGGTAPGN